MVEAKPSTAMIAKGIYAGADGECPVCGRHVHRLHSFDGARLKDTYQCYRCGPTTYAVAVSP